MKAKTLLLIILCAVSFSGNGGTTDPPEGIQEILLHGTLDLGNGPSRIEAYLYGEFVYVNFNHNYGNVSVSLYNAFGLLVYNDVVDTSVQQTDGNYPGHGRQWQRIYPGAG